MKLYKQVDNKIELCIFPWLEKEMRKLFHSEIEQGRREELEDGRIYFSFEITPEKASLLHVISDWIQHPSKMPARESLDILRPKSS